MVMTLEQRRASGGDRAAQSALREPNRKIPQNGTQNRGIWGAAKLATIHHELMDKQSVDGLNYL